MYCDKAGLRKSVKAIMNITESEPRGSAYWWIAKIALGVLTVIGWCFAGYVAFSLIRKLLFFFE